MFDSSASAPKRSLSWTSIIHYAILALLVVSGVAYWTLRSPTLNPMADPMAAEAMALVQTHRAQHAPTIRQAVTDRVQSLRARGMHARLGDWTVQREQEATYVVRIWIREQETKEWFEREYVWRVNVSTRAILPLTMSASDLMPARMETETPSASPSSS
jgi:hypothetical protein